MILKDEFDSDIRWIFPTMIIQTNVSDDDFELISKEIDDSLVQQKSYVASNQIGNSPYFSNGKETRREVETEGYVINRSPKVSNYINDYSLNTLSKIVEQQLEKYIDLNYPTIPNHLRSSLVLNSWLADYRDEKTYLLAHQHETSFINVVYYHQMNGNRGGELVLYPPNAHMNYINPSQRKVFIKPKPGMMILFPSWMNHAVNSFSTEHGERRISISITCNFPKDE